MRMCLNNAGSKQAPLVQDRILLEEKSTSDLIPCGKKPTFSLITLTLWEPLGFLVKYQWETRTTTLHRLSCSCYLVVKSVQAWWISTTVSCWKRQDRTDRAGWGPLEGTYSRWRTVRTDEPTASLSFNYGSISATCQPLFCGWWKGTQ